MANRRVEEMVKKVLKENEDVSSDLEESLLLKLNTSKNVGTPKNQRTKRGNPSQQSCSQNSDQADDLAARVAEVLLPALASEIDKIVKKRVETAVRGLAELFVDETERMFDSLKTSNRILQFEIDRLEQYSRRETVRISGLGEVEREDTEVEVMKLFEATGCEIKKEEISAVHRNGRKGEKPRPILVKFTSRRSKASLMMKRRALKDKEQYKGVYINDDLTPMRAKLLRKCKNIDLVESCRTTHDGRIRCQLKQAPGHQGPAKVVMIETPDDLFHLGFNNIDYDDFLKKSAGNQNQDRD